MLSLIAALLLTETPATGAEEAVTSTRAEEVVFAPDRPGFADSTFTVPVGHAQIELGVRANKGDGSGELIGPSMLLRVGLTRHLEARMQAPDVIISKPDDGDARTGVGDMTLGLKLAGGIGDAFSASL